MQIITVSDYEALTLDGRNSAAGFIEVRGHGAFARSMKRTRKILRRFRMSFRSNTGVEQGKRTEQIGNERRETLMLGVRRS